MDEKAAERELARLLKTEVFERAPRMRQLLSYLVGESLRTDDEAHPTSYDIAAAVFGRDSDFDPSTDSIVRVEVARLRRMLKRCYLNSDDQGFVIPRGGYRVQLASDERISGSFPAVHGSECGPGVVVMPFECEQENESLARGVGSELVFQLGRFPEYRIVDGRGAPDGIDPMRWAIDAVECQFLIRGEFSARGENGRLRVDLLDATNAAVLWAGRFTLELNASDLLERQARIAASISRRIASGSGAIVASGFHEWQKSPDDWDAADCVFRWHYYRAYGRSEKLNQELGDAVAAVLRRHMGFSVGWMIRAFLTLDSYIFRLQMDADREDVCQRARKYAERAISLDSSNAQARYVNAIVDYFCGDRSRYVDGLRDALALNPNSIELLHHGGTLLAFSGEWAEGKSLVEDAGMHFDNAMGYRFFYIVEALRDGDDQRAQQLLATVGQADHLYLIYLLKAVVFARMGDERAAQEQYNLACERAPCLSGNVAAEIDKWFSDDKIVHLMGAALEPLV